MNIHPITLPKISDPRGNLSFFENELYMPFVIKRTHWIYDVPGGAERGGIAYGNTDEFIVALSGSFDVVIDDGTTREIIPLNRSYYGVYVPKGMWRAISNFSTNSVALIAASSYYDPHEGIRDYMLFKQNPHLNSGCDVSVDRRSMPDFSFKKQYTIYDCSMIELDKHHSDSKGNISVVENRETVPFDVKRIYYLYDIPGGENRGGHAHKQLFQLIIAVSGCFTVTLDDGNVKRTFILNRPYQGLLVTHGIWRTLSEFSSGSVCIVLASEKYDENDYIRDYDDFLKYRAISVIGNKRNY